MAACAGITRAGKRCQITSTSAMADSNGRLVAGPLRRGSPFCLFHSRPFIHFPTNTSKTFVLLLHDLETTGMDVSQCRIVELAATQAFDRMGLPGACFGQVVRVDDEILRTPSALAASAVHGISDEEILASPPFTTVWERFLDFVESLLNNCVQDNGDSDEEPGLPQIPDEPPTLLMAAHNGYVDMEMCALPVASDCLRRCSVRFFLTGTSLTSLHCWRRASSTSCLSNPSGVGCSWTPWEYSRRRSRLSAKSAHA